MQFVQGNLPMMEWLLGTPSCLPRSAVCARLAGWVLVMFFPGSIVLEADVASGQEPDPAAAVQPATQAPAGPTGPDSTSGAAGTETADEPQNWLGVVVARRKYSFAIQSHQQLLELETAPGTIFRRRLIRPRFEWDQQRIICDLPALTTPGAGEGEGGQVIPLQLPLYIRGRFQHEAERTRCWDSGLQRRLPAWSLESTPPASELFQPVPDRPELLGRLESVNSRDVATIDFGETRLEVLLLDRDVTIDGQTILDLEPLTTLVEVVTGPGGNGKPVAREVIFTRVPDPLAEEKPGLPRCLVLGDEVSLSWMGWLREDHRTSFNFWHPPENCRGGGNRSRIPLWLGPWKTAGRQWDLIVFNFGLANLQTPDADYETMLRAWVAELQPTAARLVWVQSVPRQPADLAGQAGELARLNRVAAQTLANWPEIRICDPMAGLTVEQVQAMKPAAWQQHLADRVAEAVGQAAVNGSSAGQ